MNPAHEARLPPTRAIHHAGSRAAPANALARAAMARFVGWIRQEYRYRRSAAALRELDDRLLADIGLNRVAVTYGLSRRELIFPLDEPIRR